MKVLIAEDEAPQREELVRMLRELAPDAELVAICEDGLDAIEAFERDAPDVAFLDVRMPGLGGLAVARALTGVAIVFVTAYDDAAVQAFEEGAVDYLLKPVRRERLERTLARLAARREPAGPDLARLEERLGKGAARERLRWVTASLGDVVRLYPIADVIAFQAQDKYTRVLTKDGDAVIRTSLKELTRSLDPEEFWQVHRSLLVRALAVESLRRDGDGKAWLTLKGSQETFPVSSAFYRQLRGM